jgi:hypothetical protein
MHLVGKILRSRMLKYVVHIVTTALYIVTLFISLTNAQYYAGIGRQCVFVLEITWIIPAFLTCKPRSC